MPDDFGALTELGGAADIEMVASALAERGARPDKCHNCGTPVIGAFCAHCGQEHDSHRRSVMGLARDVFGEVATFDSRILRTIVALLFLPGEIAKAFRDGRPRRYVPAFRIYLFSSLVFFLVLGISGIAIMQFRLVATPAQIVTDANGRSYLVTKDEGRIPIPKWGVGANGPHYTIGMEVHFLRRIGSIHTFLAPQARAKLDEDRRHAMNEPSKSAWETWLRRRLFAMTETLANDPAAINRPLTEWIPRVLFVLLPLFALLLAAFYWRQRKSYYFVDHLIFSLNLHSFLFVVILVAGAFAQIVPGEDVAWGVLAVTGLYFLIALKRFYAQNWLWTATKFVCVSFLYTTLFVLPALAAIIVVSLLDL